MHSYSILFFRLLWSVPCFYTISPPDYIPQASTSASIFGLRIPYGKETAAALPPGYQLQFGEALQTACEQMILRWATPAWAYKLPIPPLKRFLSHMQLAYQELEGHLRGLITESRLALKGAKSLTENDLHNDLLRRLVESNAVEVEPEKRLTDEELLSNMFVRIHVTLEMLIFNF